MVKTGLYRSLFFFGLMFFAYLSNSFSQVVINEVCSRNSSTLIDEEEEYNDWIELYNPQTYPINLEGWFISDNINEQNKWEFPEIIIEPESFLVLFASGKNRKLCVDHWENIIHSEDDWKYLAPLYNPDTNWAELDFYDNTWHEGPGGFGRGDGDDNTILSKKIRTVYLRKKFNIPDTSMISYMLLHVDYDDAFVAYLNGVEVARANIGWPGKVEAWDDYAWGIHEAAMYKGLPPEKFILDIDLVNSLLIEGENVFAIQGLNAWNNHGNFSLIPFLSIGVNKYSPYFELLPVWFGENPIYLHTNFKISGEGESIILSKPNMELADAVDLPYLGADHSYGKIYDGSAQQSFFINPTPGLSNNSSIISQGYSKEPEFNMSSGFYFESLNLEFVNYIDGDTIRYTTDGSWPNDTSLVYSNPIVIDSTMTLRARIYKHDFIPGNTVSKSYFIDYASTLPVITISMNPQDLWDWDEGIYVLGPNAQSGYPYFGANYWQDWEKPAHVKYFDDKQNLGFELDLDIVIHGGFSRVNPMKSLRLITNGKYNQSSIDYKVFEDKDITSFKKLVLRNSGQDYNVTHFRDGFMQQLVKNKTAIETQGYQPAVVFLNGEYWGIHNIREKIDRYYVNENFGVHVDSCDVLRNHINVTEGDYYNYVEMLTYILNVPSIDSSVFSNISSLIDLNNFTDYFIAEMFFLNREWPRHNSKYWRARSDSAKWRYILVDTDFGFGLYHSPSGNELHRVLHESIPWAKNHKIFRRIMEYDKYQHYFVNRSADMFNTILHTNTVLNKIDETKNFLAEEMVFHMPRWGSSFGYWENEVEDLYEFGEVRLDYVWQHYIEEFGFEKLVSIDFDIDSIIHGKIKVNTIIPDSIPWQGIYFDGNPIEISAIADTGFMFSHWASNSVISGDDTLKSELFVNVDTSVCFKAFFSLDTVNHDTLQNPPLIVFNEINYRSNDTLDTGDWIELYNIDTVSVNISNWIFKDGNDNHEYYLPEQTILDTGALLVLFQDSMNFFQHYPEIINSIGPFEFGLASEGENLRLFNDEGLLVLYMNYSNDEPWPLNANGTGRTIELIDPVMSLSDGTNWFDGCIGGSPGNKYMPCDTVGIEYSELIHSTLQVYPNPSSGKVNFDIYIKESEDLIFTIFDYFGTVIRNEHVLAQANSKNQITLQKGELNKGIYFYQLSGQSINHNGKFIIQ